MGSEEIQRLCKERGIDHTKLQYNKKNGLLENACMSKDCPHFLKPVRAIRSHMSGWQWKLPYGFHSYVSNHSAKSVDDIYEGFEKERSGEKKAWFGKYPQEVKSYIAMIQSSL